MSRVPSGFTPSGEMEAQVVVQVDPQAGETDRQERENEISKKKKKLELYGILKRTIS